MSCTPHPKYPNLWVLRWYAAGRKKDPKTGKASNKREYALFAGTEAEAQLYYASLLRQAKPEKAGAKLAPTLNEAWPDFIAHYRVEVMASTVKDFLNAWKRLQPTFGPLKFNHITPQLIVQYKTNRLQDGVKPRTITRELIYLKTMCTWASKPENNYCDPLNFTITGFKNKLCEPPKPIVLTIAETELILANMNPKHPDRICIFMLYADLGLRRNEALHLKAEDVNLQRREIRIIGKGNKEEMVYISTDRLLAALTAARKQHPSGYLFPNPNTGRPFLDIKYSIKNAALKAGIDKRIYNHLFRHSFCTSAIESGVESHATQQAMRHSKHSTTEKYIHLTQKHIRTELRKLKNKTEGMTQCATEKADNYNKDDNLQTTPESAPA